MTNTFRTETLEKCLSVIKEYGISDVEASAGGLGGKDHCDPAKLLTDKTAFYKFCETFNTYDMEICSLSVCGNPVHPDAETAKKFGCDFKNAVLLAEKLEIDTVVTESGCPGDSIGAKYPNWVSGAWAEEWQELLEWQWNEVLVPYWTDAAAFAKEHGVTRLAVEMKPGNCVYNPESLLRLRAAVGDVIGATLDPSYLILQGIDPAAAVKSLGGAVFTVHAKDVMIDKYSAAINGMFDTKAISEPNRSWMFRTVGCGQSDESWKELLTALAVCGYDGAISVECNDRLIAAPNGLKKAVNFLDSVI